MSRAVCGAELNAAKGRARQQQKTHLTDIELCHVSIAYNRGSFDSSKGLKQGYKIGGRYYGEKIFEFLHISKNTPRADEPSAALSPPSQGTVVLPTPTQIEGKGKMFLVDVKTYPLRMWSSPEIPPENPMCNVIARPHGVSCDRKEERPVS